MTATREQLLSAIASTRAASAKVRQSHSTERIVSALAETARRWLVTDNPWRERAVVEAPAATGFSVAMVHEAVGLTFGALTKDAFEELLRREVGDRRPFHGPGIIAHFLAGNVPPPSINSICFGLLLKSANLVKVSGHDPVFPSLFVESLRGIDAGLADCVAVLDWRREEHALTETALAEADAVIAYGDDETIATLRRICRPDAHFVGHGHKLSFAVIAKDAVTKENLPSLVEAAAFDVSVYDQQGCLSPHAFYVEEGGQLGSREFAAALAEAMAAYQARVPRGTLSVEESAQIAKLRGAYEFRSATDRTVAIWASINANSWLVIYEEDPMFTPSCLNRVVFVKPIKNLESIPKLIERFASNLSTVGIAPMNPALSGMNEQATTFAAELAKVGVNRVCPVGQMQQPPLGWNHDGRPNLAELARWRSAHRSRLQR